RTMAGHRGRHGVTRDAKLSCDSPLRQTLAAVKMPDQGPVFQEITPSNLIGWPTFQPSQLAGSSTVVNRRNLVLTGPPPKFHGARDIFELLLGQP
ncbi:hypothetical protein, partial [Mycobacterium avium]|uniref:hypothetical protein n=2 Tax=Mycobacterium avium TaxID=1764 RepID=UPI00355C03CB